MNSYQISFFQPSPVSTKHRPRQRKGESWESYCVRYETWARQTFPEKTQEQRNQEVARNEQFRESVLRANEVFCYLQVEKAKKEYRPGRDVFFWFGGELGFPGAQSQYVNRGTLELLLKMASTKPQKRAGKIRVSFGACLGG